MKAEFWIMSCNGALCWQWTQNNSVRFELVATGTPWMLLKFAVIKRLKWTVQIFFKKDLEQTIISGVI